MKKVQILEGKERVIWVKFRKKIQQSPVIWHNIPGATPEPDCHYLRSSPFSDDIISKYR
jgi:hypothetical protein